MELPMRFLVLLMLMVLALIAAFAILNPIQSGSLSVQQMAERNSACSNWSMDDCNPASDYLQDVEKIFGCSGADECKAKCSGMKYCLT